MRGFESGATEFVGKSEITSELVPLVDRMLRPSTRFKEMCVLVVDDSRLVRKMVVKQLKTFGVDILEAASAEEGFQVLREQAEAVNLVISDVDMGEMSGKDLCRKMRTELGLRDLPLIFLTATDDLEGKLSLFECGGTDFIQKPFVKEEFAARVVTHLAASSRLKRILQLNQDLALGGEWQREFANTALHDLRVPISNSVVHLKRILKNHANELSNEVRELFDSALVASRQAELVTRSLLTRFSMQQTETKSSNAENSLSEAE